MYHAVAKAVSTVMTADSVAEVSACLDNSGWDKEIKEDYDRRGKRVRS